MRNAIRLLAPNKSVPHHLSSWAMAVAIVVFGVAVTGTQSARAQTYNVLYSFTGGADGAYPFAPLVLDAEGNLYGTTEYGGSYQNGAVFKLDSSGTETVLYSFNVSGTGDGELPFAGLVLDVAGNLYGTTQFGGTFGSGTVFKVDTSGNETVLYSFTGGADGANPRAGLVLDACDGDEHEHASSLASLRCDPRRSSRGSQTDGLHPAGTLYGTTYRGGSGSCVVGCGVVFKLDVRGKETVLYTFTGGADGANPSGVILDKAGSLYGTTSNIGSSGYGTVFKVNKSGKETVLHSFTGYADGSYPYAPLVLDVAGNLYGTTQYGGVAYGTVFKLNKSGKEFTVLHSFTGGADGAQPYAGLVLDACDGDEHASSSARCGPRSSNRGSQTDGLHSTGTLYGTTYFGGGASIGGYGTVFKVDKNGAESVLHSFAGGTDGAYPYAGLVQDTAGNLYGTTEYGGGASIGGASGYGTVFKLNP